MKKAWKSLILGTLVTSMTACSGGGAGSDAAPSTSRSVTISGGFDTNSLSSVKPMFGVDIVPMAASDYGVYCMVISGSGASTSYGGPLGVDGKFSFVASFPAGAPVGCLLTKDENIVTFFSFKTVTDTKGKKSHVRSYAMKEDTTSLDFGNNLSVNADDVVGVAAVADDGTTSSSNVITDLTGSWQVVKTHEDPANGYYHPCDLEDDMSDAQMAACKASWGSIYLNMYKFTNAASEERYGVSLWENSTAFSACGSAEGYNGSLNGWTVETGFNANGPKIATAFPTPSIALHNLVTGGTVLAGAPFKYYAQTQNGRFETNCPIMPEGGGSGTNGEYVEGDVPAACKDAAKTTCASFTEAEWESGITSPDVKKLVSARKVQCVMSTLTSGGATGYNWGASCAARLSNEIWNSMYSNGGPCTGNNCGWGDTNMEATSGTGCKTETCADAGTNIAGIATYWNSSPRNRHIQGEVTLTGAVASGTTYETRNENVGSNNCPVVATTSYTFTKTGANTMDAMVEQILTRGAGWGTGANGTEEQCLGTAASPTWLGESFKMGGFKIKLGFQKQ